MPCQACQSLAGDDPIGSDPVTWSTMGATWNLGEPILLKKSQALSTDPAGTTAGGISRKSSSLSHASDTCGLPLCVSAGHVPALKGMQCPTEPIFSDCSATVASVSQSRLNLRDRDRREAASPSATAPMTPSADSPINRPR